MRVSRYSAAGAMVVAVAACSTAVSGFGAIGTFQIVDIDGTPPPAMLSDGTVVMSASITLNNEANCFTSITVTRPPSTAQEQVSVACTWSQSGTSLAIVWPDGSPSFGTVIEDRLSFTVSATTPNCPPVTGAACAPSDWSFER